MFTLKDKQGKDFTFKYWRPEYSDKLPRYCRAGYPIETFFRLILPNWLKEWERVFNEQR